MASGVGIAVAVSLCMATIALMEGLSEELVRGTTEGEMGHVQVHHPEYLDARALRMTVDLDSALPTIRGESAVAAASPRLYGFAYLNRAERSSGVQVMGIDPIAESRVTVLERKLLSGRWLDAAPTPWARSLALDEGEIAQDRELTERAVDAAFLSATGMASAPAAEPSGSGSPAATIADEDEKRSLAFAGQLAPQPDRPLPALLGATLAANLGLAADPEGRWGQRATLLLESASGAQTLLELEVRGIVATGVDQVDRSRVIMHVADVQRMLDVPGSAHEIAVRLVAPKLAQPVADRLQQRLGAGTSVRSWSQLRPDVQALILANRALIGTLAFIIFLVAGFGVLNTMLVAVVERQHELSLLKALGLSARAVVGLVVSETALLCLAAGTIGMAFGLVLIGWLQTTGIDISRFGDFTLSGVGMTPVLRGRLSALGIGLPIVFLALVALLAALVPAIRAARLAPAAGMRTA